LNSNNEIIYETLRTFGTLTSFNEIRTWFLSERLIEAILILIEHNNFLIVYQIIGILINLTNCKEIQQIVIFAKKFIEYELIDKIISILETNFEKKIKLINIILKLFYNLFKSKDLKKKIFKNEQLEKILLILKKLKFEKDIDLKVLNALENL
jgi:hypothetical protein